MRCSGPNLTPECLVGRVKGERLSNPISPKFTPMSTRSAILLLCLPLLTTLTHAQTSKADKSSRVPKTETLSEEALQLQGVWTKDNAAKGPGMARMIVHGTYFLLIYQWSKNEARVIELNGFTADGEKVRDRNGEAVITYIMTEARAVNFEILDESPDPVSKYMEFGMKRTGVLPDLNLKASTTMSPPPP